jgi:hypothetical protein
LKHLLGQQVVNYRNSVPIKLFGNQRKMLVHARYSKKRANVGWFSICWYQLKTGLWNNVVLEFQKTTSKGFRYSA